ncbi:hypothetical protein Tco_1294258 [Tanacetum coccineum]
MEEEALKEMLGKGSMTKRHKRRRLPVPRCDTRAHCATHYYGDWHGSFLEEVAFVPPAIGEFLPILHRDQELFVSVSQKSVYSASRSPLVWPIIFWLSLMMDAGLYRRVSNGYLGRRGRMMDDVSTSLFEVEPEIKALDLSA